MATKKYLDETGLSYFWGKIKAFFLSAVSYDTTNKKLTYSKNGTATDIVTAADIVTDGGGITSHQDITGKADKVSGATTGNLAGLDANGNIYDSGKKASEFVSTGDLNTALATKQNTLTFDNAPTADSNNPVKSSGIKTAVDAKYTKPVTGIPKTDLTSGVQSSLDLADSAVQAEPVGDVAPAVTPYDYATRAEVNQLGQEVIGITTTVTDASAGTYPYKFVSGKTYIVKNLSNSGVTISHRETPSGTSSDVKLLAANSTLLYTVTSDGNYLRYGDPVNLTISISDGVLEKMAALEEQTDTVELVAKDNKGDLDTLTPRHFTSTGATTFDYNFIEGKPYFIESKGSTEITITLQDSGGQAISGHQYSARKNMVRRITAPAGAAKVRVGGAADIYIYTDDKTYDLSIEGKYFDGFITTKKSIGETVDIESITMTAGWKHSIVEVAKGDQIEMRGAGGTAPAPYCFVDYDYKVVYVYTANSTYDNTLSASCDGFCIVNSDGSNGAIKLIRHTQNTVERIEQDLHPAEFSSTSATFFPYHFVRGEKYILTCLSKLRGLSVPVQTTFSLRLYNNLSATAYNSTVLYGFGDQHIFVADADANYIRTGEATVIQVEKYDSYARRVKDLENKVFNYGEQCAAVDFDFDNSFINPAADLTGVAFTQSDIMEQIYSKFDSLVSSYSSYVTRVDAASSGEANIAYPSYASLNGSASGDYAATPTYKTYMYKLISTEAKANQRLKKKKILIVGGTHGNEVAAPFNLYLFAKNLCASEMADYFKLRGAFDIYILPCLNGYGMYHNQRYNANGVDINRNFPIANWSRATSVTDKGASAGDQFETQLVMALVNKYNFDVLIDHHNFGAQDSQFYVDTSYTRFLPLTYKCLVDCSHAFVKNLPAYFGNKYKLFYNIDQSAPYSTQSAQLGFMTRWGFEKGLPFACTLEIGQKIEYSNGTYAPSANDSYTADSFAVGEFTLRNGICRYCGLIIGNTQ